MAGIGSEVVQSQAGIRLRKQQVRESIILQCSVWLSHHSMGTSSWLLRHMGIFDMAM